MAGTPGRSGGHNAKTRDALMREGTFRKDRHGDLRSPEPPAGRPEMPSGLDEVGQEEWGRLVDRLEQSGSLTKVDDRVIYQAAKLFAEIEATSVRMAHLEACVERLEENLGDFKGEDFIKLIQEITAQQKLISKCIDQLRSGRMGMRQYLVEFGLTPASRGRIKLPPQKDQPKDDFSAMQRSRLARVK
jgi:phage terminase small subunit